MKKILLVHGWNYKLYNSNKIENPWEYRKEFLDLLEREFSVDVVKLPGFCGTPEPRASTWNTQDYGDWLFKYLKKSNINYDFFVGYSFGSAVLVSMSLTNDINTPSIYISPAFRRSSSIKSIFAQKVFWVPQPLREYLKSVYLYFLSSYYRYGTGFLRRSYNVIVRENSIDKLIELSKKSETFCIYGTLDTATSYDEVKCELKNNDIKTYLIEECGHDIGKTHPEKLFLTIKNITS
jgi:hypothetical protein